VKQAYTEFESTRGCECGRAHDVVLVDRVPAFRRGLVAALTEHALRVHELDRPGEAVLDADAVVVAVRTPEEHDALAGLCAVGCAPAVVVLAGPSLADYLSTLARGAVGVVAEDEPLHELVSVVAAACHGRSRLPAAVTRALSERAAPASDSPQLAPRDLQWLRSLAANQTVAQLAREESYSEREMHRRLTGLYERIGARSRIEAVVLAARWGLAP